MSQYHSIQTLKPKAKLLRSSLLFSARNKSDPYSEKKLLFLALASAKPVSAAASSRWVTTERGGKAAPDDPAEVGKLLRLLGLAYELEVRGTTTLAYVSLESAWLRSFLARRNDHREAGRWFGYPTTAVEAFATGDLMEPGEQEATITAFGLPVFSTFRLSRDHAVAEIEVMRRWWQLSNHYDMA
jgi:hypothetical protein